jgi:hypothetical protein
MVYDAATSQMLLFGGYVSAGIYLNDVWAWNGTAWTLVVPTSVLNPSGRYNASLGYNAATQQVVLFGGVDLTGTLSDTWTLTGTSSALAWTLQSPATIPPARSQASMAYDTAASQLVLFGGTNGAPLGDTWSWSGTNWSLLAAASASTPPLRSAATLDYDASLGQLVLFGGTNGAPLADTWAWNGTAWAPQSPAGGPPARSGASLAYDAASGQVLLFGGSGASGLLNDTWTRQLLVPNLGTANVCPTAATTPSPCSQSATISFNVGSAAVNVASVNVLTQGAPNLDFTSTTTTCTGALTANAACTVTVQFAPTRPGLRSGGISFADSSNNLLGGVLLSGSANGPQVVFPGNTTTNLLGTGYTQPSGVAVDGAGNVYVADSAANTVQELLAVGGTVPATPTTLTLGSGFAAPAGIAVDGAGNVYVADAGNNVVKELVAVGGSVPATPTILTLGSGFAAPAGIAVDAVGNVYVTDSGNNAVKEIVAVGGVIPASSPSILTLGSGFVTPKGVAVDGAGNVYVADYGNNKVKKLVAVGGSVPASPAIQTLGSGFVTPAGVSVDSAGNVYVAVAGSSAVKEIVAGGSNILTLAGTFVSPVSAAVDGSGNVYVADSGNATVTSIPLATANTVAFATATTDTGTDTTDGTQTVTVANNGNQPLVFAIPTAAGTTNPTTATDFTFNSTGGGACSPLTVSSVSTATLASGATCNIPLTFTPAAATPGGALSESVTLTDNNLNATGATQSISLTGTAIGLPTFTVVTTVSTPTANAALSNPDAVTPNTPVTYTFSVTNTSVNPALLTTLSPNLSFIATSPSVPTPSGIAVTFSQTGSPTLSANLSGCNIATTACSVPAGATVTYSVTGVFLASAFSTLGSGPYTVAQTAAASVSFTGPGLSAPKVTNGASAAPNVNVQGNVVLGVTLSTSSSSNNFSLGSTGVTLTAAVTNSGVDQAGTGQVVVALPKGFIVSPLPTSPSSCNLATTPATCTLAFTSIAPTATMNLTVTGSFSDTGTTSDAVAPPLTAATPSASTVSGSATSGSVTLSVAASGITLNANQGYMPASAAASAAITVSRSNTLTYGIVVGTPVSLATATVNEANPTNANDVKSIVNYTVTLTNSGTSIARGLLFTVPVPLPSNVTLGTPTISSPQIACGAYTAGAFTCYSKDLTPPGTPLTAPAAGTYTITFTATYNELTVPFTAVAGKTAVTQVAGTLAAAGVYSAFTPSVSPAVVTVQRQTSIAQTLTDPRVGAAPSKFADTTDMNLDEHVALNAAGVNDTLNFSLVTSNAGPNDAAGVSVSVPSPAYSMVINYPATCTIGGVPGGATSLYTTGSTGATMTCTPPSITTNAGTNNGQIASSALASNCSAVTSSNTVFDKCNFVVNFSLKFVDAASNATVVGSSPTATVTFAATTAAGSNVNTGTANIITPAAVKVQRAAHLRLSGAIPLPLYTDGATATNGFVAEAAYSANPVTFALTSGKVYNCFRYKVGVVNDGPNYTNLASINYAIDLPNFVSTQTTVGTPTNQSPLNCVGSAVGTDLAGNTTQTFALGVVNYGGGTATVSIDGYFDVAALGVANSGTATLQTKKFTAADYSDSNLPATNAATPDYQSVPAPALTVGNTPFNSSSTTGFVVTPQGAAAPIKVGFTQVDKPGITSSSSSSVTPTLPSGKSPYPPDAGATKTLYQPGIHPTYYSVFSTATSSATSNPTTVCIVPGTAFADTFVKPERVLLWVLGGATTGTTYNSVPNITSTGSLAGDITYSVTPSTGAYVVTPPTISFPQVPQAQPAQICGIINGVPLSTGTTLGLLEPVNFAPYVVGGTASVSVLNGKGVTVQTYDAFLNVSKTQTYDFNDSDPCYAGTNGARTKCNDNPYLFAMTFGGGHTAAGATPLSVPAAVSSLKPETNATTTSNAFLVTGGFNLGSGDQVYIAVFDQATGADAKNSAIQGSAAYPLTNPYASQGGFLVLPYSAGGSFVSGSSSASPSTVCDPGSTTAYYVVTPIGCTSKVVSVGQVAVNGGSGYLGTTVGAISVTGSGAGGSGLIALPYPDGSTPPTGPAVNGAPYNPGGSQSSPLGVNSVPPPTTTAAIAYVTPGQTAGFQWNWLSGQAPLGLAKGPTFGDVYTLGCEMVDLATQQTVIQPPAGISCTISTTTPDGSNKPQSYTFQDTTATPYTGSSTPTIFVITSGNLYAGSAPFWQRTTGGVLLALMLPVLIFRRRIGRASILLMALLTLAATPMLSGCGSSSTISSGTVAPAGSYLFRVTATPPSTKPTNATITSAPFEVVVQNPN